MTKQKQQYLLRIAEYSGLAILLCTALIREVSIYNSYSRRSFFREDAFLMLCIYAVPCISLIFLRPFTTQGLSAQQRFAIAAICGAAILLWWAAFGLDWIQYDPYWESRITGTLPIMLTAYAWYLRLGWVAASGEIGTTELNSEDKPTSPIHDSTKD